MEIRGDDESDRDQVVRWWPAFVEALRKTCPPLFSFLETSEIGQVEQGTIHVLVESEFGVKALRNGIGAKHLQTFALAMNDVLRWEHLRIEVFRGPGKPKSNSWRPKSLTEIDAARKVQQAEAFDAEVALRPELREVVQEYRAMFDKHEYGFCPVCGQRTAIKSNGDWGVGPTVQVYCNSGECPAREIDITVKRGFMWKPLEWDSQENQTTSRQRVSDEKKRRPNQQVWRKMWRVRHGGTLLCNLCGVPETEAQIQLDHIVELRDGGEDADWNTQPLCVDCHQRKTSARGRR